MRVTSYDPESMESRKKSELEYREKLESITAHAAREHAKRVRICGSSPLGHVYAVEDHEGTTACVGCGVLE